jgi:hypothetical protein
MKHYIIPANAYHKLKTQQSQQQQQQQHHQQQPPPPPPPSLEVVSPVETREEEEEEEDKFIIDAFPQSIKGRATRLLQYIEKHKPKIVWSRKDGSVTIDDVPIPGSNIIDLIRSAVTGLVKKKAEGWQEFNAALKSINTPMALVSPRVPPGTHDKKQRWFTH